MGKKSGSGFGMNNPDHFFGLKKLDADPGSRMKKIRIRDGKNSDPGQTSRIRNTDGNYSIGNSEDKKVHAVSFLLLSISLLQDPSPGPYSQYGSESKRGT